MRITITISSFVSCQTYRTPNLNYYHTYKVTYIFRTAVMAVWISIYFTQVFILARVESGFESRFESGLNGLTDGFLGVARY